MFTLVSTELVSQKQKTKNKKQKTKKSTFPSVFLHLPQQLADKKVCADARSSVLKTKD
jgi:hypothetical protein